MAYPPKFRKPFRSRDDDPRGGEGFRPRFNPRFDDRGQGPRSEFRRQDGPRGDWGAGAGPDRGFQGGGEGGFRPRRPFRGDGETHGHGQGHGQGFRPRFHGGHGGQGGGFRPRPAPQGAPGDLLSDVGDAPAHGGGGGAFRRPRPERGWGGGGGGFRDERHGPPKNALRDDEMKISGRNACRALFDQAPRRLIRVYIAPDLLATWDDVMKFCRENKLAYHVCEPEELARVAESDHHEGVCMVVVRKPVISFRDFLESTPSAEPCLVVALDGVANPHNIGAITRVAAHFGADALLSADIPAAQSGAAARTAEGALEHVRLVGCDDLKAALNTFKVAGFQILATSSHDGEDVFGLGFPARCVLLLGAEGEGVSERVMASADRKVRIPGSGKVESLNVACAASVLLGAAWQSRARGG